MTELARFDFTFAVVHSKRAFRGHRSVTHCKEGRGPRHIQLQFLQQLHTSRRFYTSRFAMTPAAWTNRWSFRYLSKKPTIDLGLSPVDSAITCLPASGKSPLFATLAKRWLRILIRRLPKMSIMGFDTVLQNAFMSPIGIADLVVSEDGEGRVSPR